ncbi:peptidoglycan DD-metalloendopeptidase family protein [Penaeicola halotolerans]|uniref:peptidoglycan DD-metalloendopeptidase family protein n=1 Tax=Penaeicola halotolerans TaxID=2793196 RepID=UPI001CF830C7|nr:peptidoglycan DD-metalloendopeptidase family protein [Penaeicola halotolerans]
MRKLILPILLVIAVGGYYIFSINKANDQETIEALKQEITVEEEVIPATELIFGIELTNLEIHEGKVTRNQTLSSILSPFNVPYQLIDELAKKSREVFDVRRIAANRKYTILRPKDSLSSQAAYFIYEPNPMEYVVYKLKDSVEVYKEARPVTFSERSVSGVIDRNLYLNMIDQGVTPDLIDQFADIFGWQLDFQRIQKGDKFKVIYEEKIVDGQVVGIGEVRAAYFQHFGNDYVAIPFEQDGQVDYFDEDGQSLRKAFLRTPVKYSRISSRYTQRRFHPVQKRYKAHLGTDYAAPTGTEIRTVGDGIVEEARYSQYNGNYVKIKHNGTYSTQYLHMSRIASGMKPGTKVKQGQVIGYVGSTGLATGPHLCFRFWKNGRQVDALKVELPSANPIKEENMAAYNQRKAEILQLISNVPFPDEDPVLVINN